MTPDSLPTLSPPPDGHGSPKKMQVRAVTSATLGTALEYFDFAIYGALSATLFPQLFFSGLGETAGLLASFATFGVGFFARPVGALVLGHLGDRYGRKPILVATLLAMGGASVLIGLLPTGQGVGIAVALVVLRCLQGFSLGGEYTGGQLVAMEHCDRRKRGLLGSFIVAGSPISQVAANLSLVVLNAVLTTAQFESWGWRVPFLASALIVGTALYIRLKLSETPAFLATTDEQASLGKQTHARGLHVLKTNGREVAWLTMSWSGPALSFYLMAVYGLSYLTKTVGLSSQEAFVILMTANGVSIVTAVSGGFLSDRIGRKKVFAAGLVGTAVGIGLFFAVTTANVFLIGLFLTASLSAIQFLSGTVPALFAEQFPTDVRYSGSALSYTLATMLFAAPAPFIAEGLSAMGGPRLVAGFTLLLLACSAFGVSRLRDGRHLSLTEFAVADHGAYERRVPAEG